MWRDIATGRIASDASVDASTWIEWILAATKGAR